MRLTRNTPDTLVLQGHHWAIMAAMVLLALSTPFWIWLALRLGDWDVVIIAAIAPLGLAFAYFREFRNWQLVLEAEYGTGTHYTGEWLTRQFARSFDLSLLKRAVERQEVVTYRTRNFRKREETRYFLALEFSDRSYPMIIGRGTRANVSRMVYSVNRWLAAARAAAPQEMQEAG